MADRYWSKPSDSAVTSVFARKMGGTEIVRPYPRLKPLLTEHSPPRNHLLKCCRVSCLVYVVPLDSFWPTFHHDMLFSNTNYCTSVRVD